jgi:hypothetical protein
MKNLVNEELNKMKYLLGYQRGMVISEQTLPAPAAAGAQAPAAAGAQAPAAASSPEDVIKKIQEILNTKYGAKLTVDGKWGNLTQTAFEAAAKSKAAPAAAAPAAANRNSCTSGNKNSSNSGNRGSTKGSTPIGYGSNSSWSFIPNYTCTAPATDQTTAEPEAQSPDDIAGVAPQSNRDQRRDRQDMRRSQRRERQDLRAQQRGQ